jgi:hypothetical protein
MLLHAREVVMRVREKPISRRYVISEEDSARTVRCRRARDVAGIQTFVEKYWVRAFAWSRSRVRVVCQR